MTTVDFYIRGPQGRLSFHNGMWGPATTLLHEAFDMAQAGRMNPTRYNVAEFESRISGADLRTLLESVEGKTDSGWRGSASAEDLAAYVEKLEDDGDYDIFGIEV